MWQDLKFAFRQLLKHPISNLIIIATIALLLGAVSTIFASIRSQAKARNPFPEPDQLVKFWRLSDQHPSPNYPYSFYESFTQELESFDQIGATDYRRSMTLTEQGNRSHSLP